MKIAIEIPLKARSSIRVPNKNFRDLAGKPLCFWMLDEIANNLPEEWDPYIDSENESVMPNIRDRYGDRFRFHLRNPWFAADHANGNHLITQFAHRYLEYDIYCQLFVTAVTLKGEIICEAMDAFLSQLDEYDSMLLTTSQTGFFWYKNQPVNYDPFRPDGLARSQDIQLTQETTGMYVITRDAVLRTGCRIGSRPLFYDVPRQHAIDIDTMDDFEMANKLLRGE